ncbi:hypothetical protein GCM10010468_64100 [Actinocorallia longicatena]|uniref:Uncharacterized protein n=1 Tax=Actinocorallia longicatena TaxID=111803 RepID=A0ABP6QI12_9ACTN
MAAVPVEGIGAPRVGRPAGAEQRGTHNRQYEQPVPSQLRPRPEMDQPEVARSHGARRARAALTGR